MKNELRHYHSRRKNSTNCFGVALQPSTLTGESAYFMSNHKNTGSTCVSLGGNAAQFFILNSSLRIVRRVSCAKNFVKLFDASVHVSRNRAAYCRVAFVARSVADFPVERVVFEGKLYSAQKRRKTLAFLVVGKGIRGVGRGDIEV